MSQTQNCLRANLRNLNNSICNALIYKPVNIEEIKLGDLFCWRNQSRRRFNG